MLKFVKLNLCILYTKYNNIVMFLMRAHTHQTFLVNLQQTGRPHKRLVDDDDATTSQHIHQHTDQRGATLTHAHKCT